MEDKLKETREKLCYIIKEKKNIIDFSDKDSSRLIKNMLSDLCKDSTREINLLSNAIDNNIVYQLLNSSTPKTILIPQLIDKFEKDFGTKRELSEWSVESWIIALNIPFQKIVNKIDVKKEEQKVKVNNSEHLINPKQPVQIIHNQINSNLSPINISLKNSTSQNFLSGVIFRFGILAVVLVLIIFAFDKFYFSQNEQTNLYIPHVSTSKLPSVNELFGNSTPISTAKRKQ